LLAPPLLEWPSLRLVAAPSPWSGRRGGVGRKLLEHENAFQGDPAVKISVWVAAFATAFWLPFASTALAQGRQAPAAQAPVSKQAAEPESAAAEQIVLTESLVQGFISVAPEINKITASLQAEPDQKTIGQLENLSKRAGFASFDAYQTVAANISMVMQGIDPNTRKFGDPKAMIRAQIKEVQADKKLKPAEKKEALDELNAALKDVQPIRNRGNIALVEKNYDQLAKLMQE
jgi:hypothetical protein